MNTHMIGTDTYAIFEKMEKGNLLMLHFIWGKKDFRLFLERPRTTGGDGSKTILTSAAAGEFALTRLQYLYNYEWYEYSEVSGHGLVHDEVRWGMGQSVRYLELPPQFREAAVELACREFALEPKEPPALAV